MHKLNLFFRLTKIDEATRTVTGIATAEQPDKAGEICDYEGTKPYYKAWSDGFSKATDGASLGNLRSMHTSIAAGKLTEVIFDDAAKAIRIVAKVVDDAEWKKVVERVYTGFSQGGEYIRKWLDGEFTRYIAEPFEVSLVDNPCLASATLDFVKMDGTIEKLALKTVETEVEQGWKANDGSFHKTKVLAVKHNVQVEADAIAAAAAAPTKEAIEKANKALGDKEPAAETEAAAETTETTEAPAAVVKNAKADVEKVKARKGLYTVARAALMIDDLSFLAQDIMCEEAWEDDSESQAAGQMSAIIKQLCDFLSTYVVEECAELADEHGVGEATVMEMSAARASGLLKVIEPSAIMTADPAKKFAEALQAIVAKAAKDEADHMDHVNGIHKAAGGIMKDCMKCMGKAAGEGDEEKVGAFKKIHKKAGDIASKAMSLGSKHKPEDDGDTSGDSEADDENDGVQKLAKSVALSNSLTKQLGEVSGLVSELTKRIDNLEKQPAARKGALFAVDRNHEVQKSGAESDEVADQPINLSALHLSPEEMRRVAFAKN